MRQIVEKEKSIVVSRPFHSLLPPELPFTDGAAVVTSAMNVILVVPNVIGPSRVAVFSLSDPPAEGAWQYAAQVGAP